MKYKMKFTMFSDNRTCKPNNKTLLTQYWKYADNLSMVS